MPSRRALSLLELLVVITIIAVLAALSLAGVSAARRSLAVAETTRRITEIQTALQAYAAGRSDAPGVEILLGSLRSLVVAGTMGQPGAFPGVVRFRMDTRIGMMAPVPGETWPEAAVGGRPAWMLAHPWGAQATDFLTDPEGNTPPLRLPRPAEQASLPADEFGISDMTPDFSAELLMLAGVLPLDENAGAIDRARERYRSDRNPSARWNDAWGNPLVLGFAWYHPRRNTTVLNLDAAGGGLHSKISETRTLKGNREDLFLQRATERYGHFRSAYIAVAAVGEAAPDTIAVNELRSAAAAWTGTSGILRRLWTASDLACNREGGTELWRSHPGSDLAARPPWSGVRTSREGGSVRMLSQPAEIR